MVEVLNFGVRDRSRFHKYNGVQQYMYPISYFPRVYERNPLQQKNFEVTNTTTQQGPN